MTAPKSKATYILPGPDGFKALGVGIISCGMLPEPCWDLARGHGQKDPESPSALHWQFSAHMPLPFGGVIAHLEHGFRALSTPYPCEAEIRAIQIFKLPEYLTPAQREGRASV